MFQKQERRGIFVYLYYNREAKKLQQFGDIIYHSKRFRYVHLYCDASDLKASIAKLKSLKYVKRVRVSNFDGIDQNFVGNLYRTDQELQQQNS